ncbi:MAG: FUSC family protein [Gluconacetobacter diazotrophicus]|nr:FUSC family protein [Gluconacetobacter diazotrophicus]
MIRRWLGGVSPELQQAARTLLSVLGSDLVARAMHLREPYWALITAVIVVQARVSSTIEAGRDQILGTLIGAVAGAAAIGLLLLGLPKMAVFAALLVPLSVLAAFKPNLRLAGVTLVVVFLFPSQGGWFDRPVDRVLAILVGAGVSLLVSALVFHTRARRQAFDAANALVTTVVRTQDAVLRHRTAMPDVEAMNDATTATLRELVAAMEEARREHLGLFGEPEPLMVRLVPMLRRLQSDVMFVARAVDRTLSEAGPDAEPVPALADASAALDRALCAVRGALDAKGMRGEADAAALDRTLAELAAAVAEAGEKSGPLPGFALDLLVRDLRDLATALAAPPAATGVAAPA